MLTCSEAVCWHAPAQRRPAPAAPVPAEPAQIASAEASWKHDVDTRREALTARFGKGTDPALRAEVLALGQADQQARGLAAGPDGKVAAAPDLRESDTAHSAQLRSLIEAHGWPTVALVGLDASNAAMLVLTHAPDHAWQRALLPLLEELADAGKIEAAPLAPVVDKELLSEGRLQRYGTQFRMMNGAMAMYAVEDPAGLDKRREHLLLPPLPVYKAQLSRMYHLPASSAVASAPTKPQ